MKLNLQMAKHLRELFLGGNWPGSSMKEQLADLTWEQAITPVAELNTIAVLVFHINYYIVKASKFLEGNPQPSIDLDSFKVPEINGIKDWEKLKNQTWIEVEHFAQLLEAMPEEKLWDFYKKEAYGTCYRIFQGIIEHGYYHLGQIAVIKKILLSN